MKNTLLALILIPSIAFAFGDSEQKQGQQQFQGQAQGQAQGLVNQQEIDSGDQYTTIKTKWESVSSSAADLNLAFCADGASGQNADGGFSIGAVNYVCEAMAALRVTTMLVEMELAAYDSGREGAITPDGKTLADRHLINAQAYMADATIIMEDVNSYIKNRRNTAGISAAAKDLTWPGILLALFFLL